MNFIRFLLLGIAEAAQLMLKPGLSTWVEKPTLGRVTVRTDASFMTALHAWELDGRVGEMRLKNEAMRAFCHTGGEYLEHRLG